MKARQLVVDIVIVLALVYLGVFCYNEGKAHDLFIDNIFYDNQGTKIEPFEAVLVTVDDAKEPLFLVEGDRGVVTVPGRNHVVIVQELDEDDSVVNTYKVSFSTQELDGRVINIVPLVKDKLPGWSYPVKK